MRILSKSLKLFSIVASLAAISLFAEETVSALQSLWNAEKDFAQMATEKGTREAFLANLTDDGVIFQPGPVKGKEYWQKQEPSESKLSWYPVFAEVSRAGDLGYTTGPWEFKKSPSDEKPSAYGQFLSIWKKQSDDSWKVVLDGGIETPPPTGKPPVSQIPERTPPTETAKIDLKSAQREFAVTEKEFDKASANDAGSAVIADADGEIRVFRSGRFPAVGRDAARLMLGYDHGKMTVKRTGGSMSSSGDLAYSFGEYSTDRLAGTEKGSYVTIWKTTPGGNWRLVVDVRKSYPAEEKKGGE
jgi:ketosteroid isomerase-like protein